MEITLAILLICVVLVVVNISILLKISKRDEKELKDLILSENSRIRSEIMTNLTSSIQTFSTSLSNSISTLTEINLKKLSEMNETLQREIKYLIERNETKLEEMRLTVDEKLHTTLEKRLSEAFKLVNQHLESVYKGIGDMQRLATEVGDLKKVLSNVKQRGMMGELHLKNILDDIIPGYYLQQHRFKNGKIVDFAIKIPSKTDDKYILLPIDAKFSGEVHTRLIEAKEKGDPNLLKQSQKDLETTIIKMAKEIKEYIMPPETTDFAIMFLPSEGLFADVLSIEGLFEKVRRDFNIIITGPTTITAILASLQIGFKTLAIEKKSHEVWQVLGAVKLEFLKFSEILEKTKRKLEDATSELEKAHKTTLSIGRKLEGIEVLDNTKNLIDFNER